MHSVKNTSDCKWRRHSCVVLSQCSFVLSKVWAVGPVHLYCTGPTFCPHRLISCVQLAQISPPVTLYLTLWCIHSTDILWIPLPIKDLKALFGRYLLSPNICNYVHTISTKFMIREDKIDIALVRFGKIGFISFYGILHGVINIKKTNAKCLCRRHALSWI